MSHTPRAARPGAALIIAVLAGFLLPLLVLLGTGGSASAAESGRVRGQITDTSGRGLSSMQVIWFDASGKYRGKRNADSSGVFAVSPLSPGRYLFQFVDRRAQYSKNKRPQKDMTVWVRDGRTTLVKAKMPKGGMIYGTATAGGKRAGSARVVAANQYGTSFEVKANSKGEFAIGGLPPANYSIFTWDARKKYAGRSVYVKGIQRSTSRRATVRLTQRAGTLSVDLYPMAAFRNKVVWVTGTNRQTGQWYTAAARNGVVTFSGVMPGDYKLAVPGAGDYLGRTGLVSGKVRSGRATFASFELTKKGGWVSGKVVDPVEGHPLRGVEVTLRDARGATVSVVRTNASGSYRAGGALASQKGLTLSVRAPHEWIDCPDRSRGAVRYGSGRATGISVTTGRGTSVPDLALPRAAESASKECVAAPTG